MTNSISSNDPVITAYQAAEVTADELGRTGDSQLTPLTPEQEKIRENMKDALVIEGLTGLDTKTAQILADGVSNAQTFEQLLVIAVTIYEITKDLEEISVQFKENFAQHLATLHSSKGNQDTTQAA